ncbi:MAG: alpha/beta hydrolase [Pseudomonadota bacterium]
MQSTKEWWENGGYRLVNGRRIFFIDTESKSTESILLIHGFPTSSWDWAKIWSPLSSQYRLVAMDMLGFGFSDKPDPHLYSIHEQADIVEGLVEQLALEHFHVLAHDYGDTVAQELLARQNAGIGVGRWKSVCFLNGGLFPETHRALLIQKLLLSPLGPLINKLTTRRRFDVSMSRVFGQRTQPSKEELDGFWALINHNNGRHIFHNLIRYMKDRKTHRERWVTALRKAKIPIGLINGSYDPVSGAHMIAHYQDIVGEPHYLNELSAIGHYPQVEAPDEVAKYYIEFLHGLSIA